MKKKALFVLVILVVATGSGLLGNKLIYQKPGPIREPSKWILVMEDNFDGYTLNESIWSYGYPPASYNCLGQCHNHQGWQVPENVIVENGLLRIKGENKTHPNAPTEHYWGDKEMPLNYTTGAITSRGKFEFKYGYIEARQKMPEGPTGFWPAFWTFQSGYPSYGEIDVQEWLSGEYNQYHTALHTRAQNASNLTSTGKTHKISPI